jgi:hypothetical protein
MQEDFDVDLKVGIDSELRRLMDTAILWRRRIYREISEETGLGTDMIIQVLKSKEKHVMTYDELATAMLLYEVSYAETDSYLKSLHKQRRIRLYIDKETKKLMVELIG